MFSTYAQTDARAARVGLLRHPLRGWSAEGRRADRAELDQALGTLATLVRAMPRTSVHAVVSRDVRPGTLARLARAGCRFEVSSPAQVDACMLAGALPDDISYRSSRLQRHEVSAAASRGITRYVFSRRSAIQRLAAFAPHASVVCRLRSHPCGLGWALPDLNSSPAWEGLELLETAAAAGLQVAGVQIPLTCDHDHPQPVSKPVRDAAQVFLGLRQRDLAPRLVDLGRLPQQISRSRSLDAYARAMQEALEDAFGADQPRITVGLGFARR